MNEKTYDCECCKEGQAEIGQAPRQKIKLPAGHSTELKRLAVLVCPHCDGPVARLASDSSR